MKISKVLHVLSVISGVFGIFTFFSGWSGGMMSGVSGIMGAGQNYMSGGSAMFFLLIAIWLAIGTIHHMMLEKKGEII